MFLCSRLVSPQNGRMCMPFNSLESFCRKWLVPPMGPLSKVTGLPHQWLTCVGSESSAATWKQLRADHKLEQIKKNPKQRSLWVGFMYEEDLLGLILNRIKYHSQGEYCANDLSLNDRVLPWKAADEPSELQLFPSCYRKRRDWSRKLFVCLFFSGFCSKKFVNSVGTQPGCSTCLQLGTLSMTSIADLWAHPCFC